MPVAPLILPASVQGFSDYFDLTADFEAVAEALGYELTTRAIVLPQGRVPDWVEPLQHRIRAARPFLRATSETARRELYVAPLFLELAGQHQVELRIEKPIHVSESLRGSLDYLLQKDGQLLVVEAKRDDLDRGLSQLVAEMIAVDKLSSDDSPSIFWGAITTGSIWQFVSLDRTGKQFCVDVALYRNPEDLTALATILSGILQLD